MTTLSFNLLKKDVAKQKFEVILTFSDIEIILSKIDTTFDSELIKKFSNTQIIPYDQRFTTFKQFQIDLDHSISYPITLTHYQIQKILNRLGPEDQSTIDKFLEAFSLE